MKGDWQEAFIYFSQTLNMLPDYYDGPSHALSEVINNSNGYAPSTWKDNRILTEK